jgi:GTP-binding protein EngB required for normal cell division
LCLFRKYGDCAEETTEGADPLKPLRDDMRESYNNVLAKVALAQRTVPQDIDDVMDPDQMKQEVQESVEELKKIKARVAKAYEEAAAALSDRKDAAGVVKFGRFTSLTVQIVADVEALQKKIHCIVQRHAATPEGKVARKIKAASKLLKTTPDGLRVFKPPFRKVYEDKKARIRSFELGNDLSGGRAQKTIMMVGMTGAGKSLHINNIINYIMGVNYSDDFRFKLILEEEELDDRHPSQSRSLAESMTHYVTSYVLHHQPGFRVDYSLVLIDTPGFADSSGIAKDEKTIQSIAKFFNDEKVDVREISIINLIIQASSAKLTEEQSYVFNSVLDIFGNDVADNISILFTFADAQTPPALEVVKKADIPYREGSTFKFNNSAVFAARGDVSTEFFWNFGFDSLNKYFRHLGGITAASLDQTKEVLENRERLQFYLEYLRKKINDGMDKLKCIESMTIEIAQLQGTIFISFSYDLGSLDLTNYMM